MKNFLLLSTFILSLTLVGCSAKNNNSEIKENTEPKSSIIQEEKSSVTQSNEKNSEDNDLTKFKEFTIIQDKVDLSGLTGYIATDNQGKRILLFKDSGYKVRYKTIFIKPKNSLKIIDTANHNGMIFQGNI